MIVGGLLVRGIAALAVASVLVTGLVAPPATWAAVRVPTVVERIGTSVQGRPIMVVRRGFAGATRDVLVVGVIHGNETAGRAVVQRLRYAVPPPGVRYWIIATVNPDGVVHATRQNGRGVDLNRNFPVAWRAGGRPWATYYPGHAPGSEPETRAVMALVRRVQPDVTIWYHQHLALVDRPATFHARQVAARYAVISGLPMRRLPDLPGTAITWQVEQAPTTAPLVVELPAGSLDATAVRRHLRAIRDVAVH